MKRRLTALGSIVASLMVAAVPVSAGTGWVDRIDDIDTVLAVRFDDDFPIASLMRATCDWARFVRHEDGSGVETLSCSLSAEPVMIPAFQGEPPTRAFTHEGGPCLWTSDYWFARDGSIVMAERFSYVVTPSGGVHIRAVYPAQPLACD